MEHRWNSRANKREDVVIYVNGTAPINATTENISSGGMYVKTRHAKVLKKNSIARVEFVRRGSSTTVPSQIIRCTENTVALMVIGPTLPPRPG